MELCYKYCYIMSGRYQRTFIAESVTIKVTSLKPAAGKFSLLFSEKSSDSVPKDFSTLATRFLQMKNVRFYIYF